MPDIFQPAIGIRTMKQIVCINWGTKFGAPYINRLYSMVSRNITPPFRFVCFTDVSDGVRSEVDCFDLPEMPGFMPQNTRGKWPKSRLWAPTLGDLQGSFLFLDLDVVDRLFARLPQGKRLDMPDTGHLIPGERPEALAQALIDFAGEVV